MTCTVCGSIMHITGVILSSIPEQIELICDNCGHIDSVEIEEDL